MWEFFLKNNRFTYLFLVALIGIGSYSIINIPKESTPEVVIPVGVVSTVLIGAPASDMEALVTNEIERGLSGLENVSKITSVSREGVSIVTVEFEASADLDSSIQDLKDTIDRIKQNLPDEAEEPMVSEVNFVDQPIMTIAISANIGDFEFYNLSKEVEKQLESISGVSRVEPVGVRAREVAVIVDQSALARFDLSLSEIINALRNANITLPIGQIESNGVSYNVAFEGDVKNTSEIENIAVIAKNGQPVYVRDLATVEDGLAPGTALSRLSVFGEPSLNSISINVYKRSGGDITKIADAVNAKIEELKQNDGVLMGVTTKTILDAGADIKRDLINLSNSGIQTVILVVLLLVITIGWREGLLAGLSIPLSFLFGFIGLIYSGNTINFLSLFSLILGIGILVDSAIVVVEGINRKMKDDPNINKEEAALSVTREFSAPLISGTLTTVAMFVGLFIVTGVIGQFISSIPFTLIFLLFASLFVSLAFLPLLASVFLHRKSATVMERKQIEWAHRIENKYRILLKGILSDVDKENKFLALIFSALIFSLSLPFNVLVGLISAPIIYIISLKITRLQHKQGFGSLKRNLLFVPAVALTIGLVSLISNYLFPTINPVKVVFFEAGDVDYLIVEVEKAEGTPKEQTDLVVRRVEEVLYSVKEIEAFSASVGSGSQFLSGDTGEKLANIFINLDKGRERTSTEIVDDLRKKFADYNDAKVTVNQPSDGPPTGAAIIVKFLGDDLAELTTLANQSAEILKNLSHTTNVETSTNNNSTEFVLNLDKEKTSALGLNPFVVSQLVRTAVYGTKATALTTLDEDIDVVVKLNTGNLEQVRSDTVRKMTITDLSNITLPTDTGKVALSELVDIKLRESSSVISHESNKRVVTVTADVTSLGNAREIQAEAIAKINTELNVPKNITISTGGGETDESNKAFTEMLVALIVGVILMVGILTLQFNSFLHMRYVLSILPYSLIGIMFGLAITQNSLSFPSIMGFIALSGIVVNNSILLIDMMNNLRKQKPTEDIQEIVLEASTSRLRPIILTTVTTVIGMIPLTYAGDLWAPLAYAVMFGLTFSVIITLILIPIIYSRRPGEVMR